MKVLSKYKALRFEAGGLNEDVVYNVYFKSDNPKYKNMDGFENNPPAIYYCTNVFSLLERLEDEIEDDVAITAIEESEKMEVNAFNDGGEIGEGNMEMVVSDVKAIKHHADELSKIVNKNTPIEAWVVSKINRAETDLSDVTHYLDGLKMEKGGITGDLHSLTDKLLGQKIEMFIEKVKPIKYYYINEDSNSLVIALDPNYIEGSKDKLSKAAKSSMDFFDVSSLKLHNSLDKTETQYSIKLKKVAKFNTGGYMDKGGRVHFTIDDEKIDTLLNNSRIEFDFLDDDGYLLSSKDFAKFEEIVSNVGYNTDKIIVHDYNYGMGGATAEGVDLFEDYDSIPENVRNVLDNYEHDFIEGNYSGLQKALNAIKKLGYTFEYYLDGRAYDLRKIGTKGKSEVEEGSYFARGGESKNGNWLKRRDIGYGTNYKSTMQGDKIRLDLGNGKYYYGTVDMPNILWEDGKKSNFNDAFQVNSPIEVLRIDKYMENGGEVKDKFKGKNSKDVWNNLDSSTKAKVLEYLFTKENTKGKQYYDSYNSLNELSNNDWDKLPKNIKKEIENFGKGGMMAKGGDIEKLSESDKYNFEIKFLKSISKVRKGDINETINDLKNALSNQEKFIGKVPTVRQYEKDGNYVETNGESTYYYYDDAEDKIMLKYNFEVKVNDSVFGGRYIPFDTREDALNAGIKIIKANDVTMADGGYMAKGGKNKNWIQDAINPNKKGALRKTAAKQGLIKGNEKLSMTDIKKLEKKGGLTAKRANLAETLKKLKKK